MIISASRRTDIPAFYSEWLINRIRAGYCTVPNPFNLQQITWVSLLPAEVDIIVFWTRNPKPLMPYLTELDQRGFLYYFQFTLLGYPRQIDAKGPERETSIDTFQELAGRIGPERLIWRYDPIVFSQLTDAQFHLENYAHIAEMLRGSTVRSVISLMDFYPKIRKRVAVLKADGIGLVDYDGNSGQNFIEMMTSIAQIAQANGMQIQSCAEELALSIYGIQPGKCIDDRYIEAVFSLDVTHQKDPSQRKACGCVVSKDIGMYDSCVFGCQYCYATSSFARARQTFEQHDPHSPSLVGWYEVENNHS